MKASELRIGNLVQDFDGKEFCVICVTQDRHGKRFIYYAQNASDPEEDFSGIPLTEEWLVKFGFVQDLSNDVFKRKIFSIQVANNTALYFDTHTDWMRGDNYVEWYLSHEWNNNHFKNDFWANPKYVHQLQNLYFALTGRN